MVFSLSACTPDIADQGGVESATREAARAYFDGLNGSDVSRIPLADDVYFVGPLRPGGLPVVTAWHRS